MFRSAKRARIGCDIPSGTRDSSQVISFAADPLLKDKKSLVVTKVYTDVSRGSPIADVANTRMPVRIHGLQPLFGDSLRRVNIFVLE